MNCESILIATEIRKLREAKDGRSEADCMEYRTLS